MTSLRRISKHGLLHENYTESTLCSQSACVKLRVKSPYLHMTKYFVANKKISLPRNQGLMIVRKTKLYELTFKISKTYSFTEE